MAPIDYSALTDFKDILRRVRGETGQDAQQAWINWLDQRFDNEMCKIQTRNGLYLLVKELDLRQIDIEFFEHREAIFPHPHVMQFVLTLRANRMLKKQYRGESDNILGAISDALRQTQRDPQISAPRVVGSPVRMMASPPSPSTVSWAQKAAM